MTSAKLVTNNSHAAPPTRFQWTIRHPFRDIDGLLCVEVGISKGLLPRWRFVLPVEYQPILEWGTISHGSSDIEVPQSVAKGGPSTLHKGPTVVWFGATVPLSKKRTACIVLQEPLPRYIMFGQAETVDCPPGALEGITFGADASN